MKKFLFSLFVGFVGLVGFGNCYNIQKFYTWTDTTINSNKTSTFETGSCFAYIDPTNCADYGKFYDTSNTLVYETSKNDGGGSLFCFDFAGYYKNTRSAGCQVKIREGVIQECQECAEVDTGAILSGSCDINYCVENGLCPTSSGSRSELKINNIVHEGRPLINISIPDNIWWDFSSNENQFDLYVGSGYDQDYIDSVLSINSYRPDSEDFTQIFVSGLTLIFPYIFVALLIVFMWKLLKRVFK